jgi:hypothetical protein
MMMNLAQTTPLMRNGMKYHRTQHTACAHDPSYQFHPSPLFGHPPLPFPISFPFGHPPIPSGPHKSPSGTPPHLVGHPPPPPPPCLATSRSHLATPSLPVLHTLPTSPSAPPSHLATRLATRLALIYIHNVVECTCPPICPDCPTAKGTCSPIRSMGG